MDAPGMINMLPAKVSNWSEMIAPRSFSPMIADDRAPSMAACQPKSHSSSLILAGALILPSKEHSNLALKYWPKEKVAPLQL